MRNQLLTFGAFAMILEIILLVESYNSENLHAFIAWIFALAADITLIIVLTGRKDRDNDNDGKSEFTDREIPINLTEN